jgi:hypothetical protein
MIVIAKHRDDWDREMIQFLGELFRFRNPAVIGEVAGQHQDFRFVPNLLE